MSNPLKEVICFTRNCWDFHSKTISEKVHQYKFRVVECIFLKLKNLFDLIILLLIYFSLIMPYMTIFNVLSMILSPLIVPIKETFSLFKTLKQTTNVFHYKIILISASCLCLYLFGLGFYIGFCITVEIIICLLTIFYLPFKIFHSYIEGEFYYSNLLLTILVKPLKFYIL